MMNDINKTFSRISSIDIEKSALLFSGLTSSAGLFLVAFVAVSVFQLWSTGDIDESEALTYILRALLLMFLLASMMVYMKRLI